MLNVQDEDVRLLKVSCLLTRRRDLTHEQFLRSRTEKHSPMLAKPDPAGPRVHRYVQLHSIPDTGPALKTATYDGVTEIWFESLEDAAAMGTVIAEIDVIEISVQADAVDAELVIAAADLG